MKSKFTPITLDKPRNFYFDFSSIMVLEKDLGISIADIEKVFEEGVRLTDLAILVRAALIHEDKDLTVEQVGSFLDMDRLSEITKTLTEAIVNSIPEQKAVMPKLKTISRNN